MPSFVYILKSDLLNRFYVGFTSSSVEDRLKQHLGNHRGFTARAKDWKIVYQKSLDTKQEALDLEKKIKKRGAQRFLNDLN